MDDNEVKYFLEAALLAAGRPLNIDQLQGLFDGRMAPEKVAIRTAIASLNEEYEQRGIIVSEVASGFRMQVKSGMAERLQKLWEERPPRYSRALFETLALIAYRQPITRGEIEEIRGVAVSSNITRQLLERDWVGTTKAFLDYFSLKKLDDLPPLSDLADWETLRVQLNLPDVEGTDGSGQIATDAEHAVENQAANEADISVAESADDDNDDDADNVRVNDLPVLYPEGGDEPADDEELAVSEWPEPVD